LKKKQTENPEPNDIKGLAAIYITPLENIVHHFETLFLAEVDEDIDENSATNLDTTVCYFFVAVYLNNHYL
jgi:hypothetical protein